MSQYPPSARKHRNLQGHRSSTSSSSNANTLVSPNNATEGGGNRGVPPASYTWSANAGERHALDASPGGHRDADTSRAPSAPPTSYNWSPSIAEAETKKSNHRPKGSSFSMTSTVVDNNHGAPLTLARTTSHRRSKSGSSSKIGPEDTPNTNLSPPPQASTKPRHSHAPQTHFDAETSFSKPPNTIRVHNTASASDPTCCGVVQESAARAREDRYGPQSGTQAQPWIVLKLMVGVTLGLLGYSAYVYVGLLVVPMLQQKRGAAASRETGIGLMVGFGVLWLWTVWAYVRVTVTAPGYARDYVQKTVRPLSNGSQPLSFAPQLPPLKNRSRLALSMLDTERESIRPTHNIGGPSYEDMSTMLGAQNEGSSLRPEPVNRATSTMTVKSLSMSVRSGNKNKGLRFNAGEMVNGTMTDHGDIMSDSESEAEGDVVGQRSRTSLSLRGVLRDDGMAELSSPVTPTSGRQKLRRRSLHSEDRPSKWLFCCWWLAPEASARPRTYIARRPPMAEVLDPMFRYCEKDGFVKPYRAHHCRSCGTCVLKYDHHCPWIGQCVGARNHKFFLNFCQAAFVMAVYNIATLLPYTIKGFSDSDVDANPQQIIIIALSALFALFTLALMLTHTQMIMQGQTTVENMHIATMRERERHQLAKAFKWWEMGGKARMLKEWDREWGDLDTEGNIWWIGGARREWEAVMGKRILGWILPIGKSPSDGLDYPVNPRFEPVGGRWRRREDWPSELR